jgi:hypothetical protein
VRLPWENDPNDREANYRRPVPQIEIVRIGAKFVWAGVVGGWLWFATRDRCEVDQLHDICRPIATNAGAKLSLAVGAIMTVAAVIDLLYLRSHEIELIFARTKSQQVAGRMVLLAVGLLALSTGTSRLL